MILDLSHEEAEALKICIFEQLLELAEMLESPVETMEERLEHLRGQFENLSSVCKKLHYL